MRPISKRQQTISLTDLLADVRACRACEAELPPSLRERVRQLLD